VRKQLCYLLICVIVAAFVGCGGKDDGDADGEDIDITEIGEGVGETETEKTGVITVAVLNVRDEPGISGKVIGNVSLGDRVTILEEGSTETLGEDTGTWYKVSTPNGDQGWVFGAYVRLDSGGSTGGDTSFEAPDRAEKVPVKYSEPLNEGLSAKDYHANGKNAEGTGDKSGALSYYGKAAEMEPDNFQFHFDLAMLLQDSGRNGEAASEYEECIRIKSDNFWAHNNLGFACINSNQAERAVVVLEKAITLEPKGPMDKDKAIGIARRNLAAAYRMTGQADKAAGLD